MRRGGKHEGECTDGKNEGVAKGITPLASLVKKEIEEEWQRRILEIMDGDLAYDCIATSRGEVAVKYGIARDTVRKRFKSFKERARERLRGWVRSGYE